MSTSCDVRSEPWLVEGAIDFLTHYIQPGFRVLETGSGASTLWFARRGCSVITYEQDDNYIAIVKSLLGEYASQVEIYKFTANYYGGTDTTDVICRLGEIYPHESFDLVLIDVGLYEERQGGCKAAIPLVKPGGVLMADNADSGWINNAELSSLMPDWNYTMSAQRRSDKFGFYFEDWKTAWWHKPPKQIESGTLLKGTC